MHTWTSPPLHWCHLIDPRCDIHKTLQIIFLTNGSSYIGYDISYVCTWIGDVSIHVSFWIWRCYTCNGFCLRDAPVITHNDSHTCVSMYLSRMHNVFCLFYHKIGASLHLVCQLDIWPKKHAKKMIITVKTHTNLKRFSTHFPPGKNACFIEKNNPNFDGFSLGKINQCLQWE